jgi:NAD(P)-dependent dehydrogenase (short-subunit alcohol dehydrogenase family)
LKPLVDQITAQGGRAIAFGLDARREDAGGQLLPAHRSRYRADRGVGVQRRRQCPIPSPRDNAQKYFKVWEMCALAGFLAGREAARVMLPRGRGTILFTGATASLRGGVGFAAFAGGKAALRALAQSMAREFGPQGLHVAHVVIDGLIDTAFAREHFAQRVAEVGPDGILNPDHIAQAYWWLHSQPRDTWTFELDLRPSAEKW